MDLEDCETHPCEAHGDDVMGWWQDTRNKGVLFAYLEHDILPRLHEVAKEVDDQAPPLRNLLNLRAAAARSTRPAPRLPRHRRRRAGRVE